MAVHPETDNPQRFAAGAVVNTDDGRQFTVERSQTRPGSLLVRFREVSDRTGAEALTGEFLFIDSAFRRQLEDDEFWPDELIGFRVRSVDGTDLGRVDDVVEGAAQYRLVVRRGSVTFEVPFVAALVPDVDRETATVTLADLPGLVSES